MKSDGLYTMKDASTLKQKLFKPKPNTLNGRLGGNKEVNENIIRIGLSEGCYDGIK